MRLKYIIRLVCMIVFVYAMGLPVSPASAAGMNQSGETVRNPSPKTDGTLNTENSAILNKKETVSNKVIAYYFHGKRRCRTCKKIEALTAETIKNNFQTELEKGVLEWASVNIDEPENKHFVKDYKLYTRSVVLVNINNGRQTRWKNLERIWQLINTEEEFKQYINEEVNACMKGD